MASIKVKYRPSTIADHEGVIYYQIIHERKVRQLNTEYHVKPDEWDENRSMVTTKQSSERKSLILSIRERIRRDVERLSKIDKRLDAAGLSYTADDVINEFRRYASEYSLFNFMETLIIKFKQNGKARTSETYTAALNSFKKFLCEAKRQGRLHKDEDMMFDSLNSEIMEAYEAWHKQRGNSPNTISFYTRILRAVYHRAVEDGIIENRNPFRHVYTGVDKTVKRAISLAHVKKMKELDLTRSPALDYARDMFLLSFYLRGMSFIDMAFLKKTDLKNGYVVYRRRKTGQQLSIAWTPEMQAILDKYPDNPTQYLLPIIKTEGINERCAYRNIGYNINHNLKNIAGMVGITIPLTMYVARHSWASAAKAKGIPLGVISEGMGHDSEATTQIYLASLDTSAVDKANSLIIKSL
ncbi:MAG: site-specific integrase [Bacteroides sp.]|nr:site-specific integrase [Bacteroides sp.]MCM1458114.1 site-specific integrase [Lachnoclostridium sp.]